MRSIHRLVEFVAILGGCAIAPACAAADPPMYDAIDLGLVKQQGRSCDASSIDDHGQIAGNYYDGHGYVGFVIPRVGGDVRKIRIGSNRWTLISSITPTGLIGGSTSPGKGRTYRPFIADYEGNHVQVLKAPWADTVRLAGLNRFGEGIGEAWVKNTNTYHAFITRPGRASVIDLGNAPAGGAAINDKGEATGYMLVGNQYEVFLTDQAGHVSDTGIPGFGYGINNLAQIVGITNGGTFITGPNGKNPRNLGEFGSGSCETQLNALNDLGRAVGMGCVAGRDNPVALVTNQEGTALFSLESRLRQQGLELEVGRAINDRGEIVADGVDGHCYVLMPD